LEVADGDGGGGGVGRADVSDVSDGGGDTLAAAGAAVCVSGGRLTEVTVGGG
jgi:hypothetical protein